MKKENFRTTMWHRPLTESEKKYRGKINLAAQKLYNLLSRATTETNGREMALAKTKLEEMALWSDKGLTNK